MLADPEHVEPDPVGKLDLLTTIDGIDFQESFERRCWLDLDGQMCHVASVADIVTMKELSQAKCRADAANLSMTSDNVQRALAMADKDAADIELLRRLLP